MTQVNQRKEMEGQSIPESVDRKADHAYVRIHPSVVFENRTLRRRGGVPRCYDLDGRIDSHIG